MIIVCPSCKSSLFKTGLKMCAQANVEYENDNIKIIPTEGQAKNSLIECNNCGKQYDLENEQVLHTLTHPLIACTKCGREFLEEELDDNHECAICRVKELDPAFSNIENADPFTLIRMLAQTRIDNLNLSKKNEQIQKRLDRAEELEEQEEKPKKRKRRTKAEIEQDNKKETEIEEIDIDEQQSESSEDIEISEDIAPDLPDSVSEMSNAMNMPEE